MYIVKNTLNKKGLTWFLSLTFIPTIIVAFAMSYFGITFSANADIRGQLLLAGAMFFPMIAAVITQKFILKQDIKELGFKVGIKSLYLKTYLLIGMFYMLIYGLTWIFVASPDFTLTRFIAQYELELPMSAGLMILIVTLSMLFVSPILNLLPSLGEELGWRGFLLKELLPLGKNRALILSGIIWGLWHLPFVLLIGFGYGEHNIVGACVFLMLITAVGVWFGHLRLTSNSVMLPSFAHAVFNAHAYGTWIILWPSVNPLIGGKVGIIALVIYSLYAVSILRSNK